MRGRPLKSDNSTTLDETLKRAKGRAAQQRYRSRKEQMVTRVHARNDRLETIVEGMTKAFLHFGGKVISSGPLPSRQGFEEIAKAYCDTAKTFLNLHAEAQEESGPPVQFSGDHLEASGKRTLGPTLQAMPHAWNSSDHNPEVERNLPASSLEVHRENGAVSSAGAMAMPPNIPFMPTYSTLVSDDYGILEGYPEPLLWKRIVRHAMLKTYRALSDERDAKDASQPWLARAHRFSLRHLSRLDLLVLTKFTLDSMMEETQSLSGTSSIFGPLPDEGLSANKYFSCDKHRLLRTAVLNDFQLHGISMADIIRPPELEGYLSKKATIKLDGNRMVLRLCSASGTGVSQNQKLPQPGSLKVVTLDTDKLVWRLVEDSMCLGDGMGFPKQTLNSAIVYSAIQIESHQ